VLPAINEKLPRIKDITCNLSIPKEPKDYKFLTAISSVEPSKDYVNVELMDSFLIHDLKYTEILTEGQLREIKVNIKYPKDSCKLTIYGRCKFEEEAKEAQKAQDRSNDSTF